MTLDEFIEHIKLNKHLYYKEELEIIVGFLEELKSLRVELEKNSKELEVYKNAFEMACWDLDNYTDTHYVTLMNEYLQRSSEFIDYVKKAREE